MNGRCSVFTVLPRSNCHDPWLSAYLPWLQSLNRRFGGGPVSQHYINAASRAYGEYCATCDSFYRFSSWRAVHATAQLLCQQRGNN
jgi:hypothetical protein